MCLTVDLKLAAMAVHAVLAQYSPLSQKKVEAMHSTAVYMYEKKIYKNTPPLTHKSYAVDTEGKNCERIRELSKIR
jgi:hypothetical protein